MSVRQLPAVPIFAHHFHHLVLIVGCFAAEIGVIKRIKFIDYAVDEAWCEHILSLEHTTLLF